MNGAIETKEWGGIAVSKYGSIDFRCEHVSSVIRMAYMVNGVMVMRRDELSVALFTALYCDCTSRTIPIQIGPTDMLPFITGARCVSCVAPFNKLTILLCVQ